ncbi:unnamed protein product [Mytilus coruscus]|uniref:Uncharacterized protein n=1 Tax=Mytilus coruscus TaxID=42192 RepID=A0A6J8CB54_MYTCO|nr:unnamed protein product [Mytilus coruscus]
MYKERTCIVKKDVSNIKEMLAQSVPVNRTETITTPDTTENVTTRDTTKIITTPYTTEIITTPDMPNTTEIITTPNMHNAKEIITTPDTTKMSTEQSAGIRENPTLDVSSTSDITLPDSFENVSITSISSPIVTFHENWILSVSDSVYNRHSRLKFIFPELRHGYSLEAGMSYGT